MNQYLKNKDLLSGLMFIMIGVVFFIGAGNYAIGTAAKMGPGYFPRILGGVLTVLGVIIAIKGLQKQAEWSKTEGIGWTLRPVLIVTIAVVLFGAALEPLGMVIAILLLVGISGLAAHDKNYRELIAIAVVMCLFCAGVFIYGLNLQMKLFPWS